MGNSLKADNSLASVVTAGDVYSCGLKLSQLFGLA